MDMEREVEAKKKAIRTSTLKFASPVSVSMIEHIGILHLYIHAVWFAIGIGLAQVAIGAVLVCILLYHSNNDSDDEHALACALAYHFFVAEAMITLSFINDWSTPMRKKHRRFAHVFLQICGIFCAAYGIYDVAAREGISTSIHGLSGEILGVLSVLSLLVGPFVLQKVHKAYIFHVTFGLPTFITSSICMSYGLVTPEFTDWAGPDIVPILIGLIMFYTTLITVTTFMKCMKKI